VPARRGSLGQRLVALAGLVVIVAVVVGILLAAGLLGSQGGGEGVEEVKLLDPPRSAGQAELEVGPQVGKLAPDFELSDFDGGRHRLSDFRGKAVYLNFWATWCTPCLIELPDIYDLAQRHEGELAVITVNRAQRVGTAREYLQNLPRNDGGNGLSFAVDGMDPNDALYNKYRGLGMPVSVFIDAHGVVTKVYNGLLRLPQMEEAVAMALQSGVGPEATGSTG